MLTFLTIVTILISCALESEFSLENNRLIDKNLIGTWFLNKSGEGIVFKENKGNTFSVTAIDDKNHTDIVSNNSFTSTIKDHKLINLVGKNENENTINGFYEYRLDNGKLNFRAVNSDYSERPITSQEELLEYFNKNIDKKGFFEEWGKTPFYKKK